MRRKIKTINIYKNNKEDELMCQSILWISYRKFKVHDIKFDSIEEIDKWLSKQDFIAVLKPPCLQTIKAIKHLYYILNHGYENWINEFNDIYEIDWKDIVGFYLKHKKGQIVTSLQVSDELSIPYELAHEIFLELINEGKIKPCMQYNI